MKLEGKVAVITGAGSGMGRAMANLFGCGILRQIGVGGVLAAEGVAIAGTAVFDAKAGPVVLDREAVVYRSGIAPGMYGSRIYW